MFSEYLVSKMMITTPFTNRLLRISSHIFKVVLVESRVTISMISRINLLELLG